MALLRTTLRLKHMERVQISHPINKRAAMGISHKEYQEMSTRPNRHEFLGGFSREVLQRPRTSSVLPKGAKDYRGIAIGRLTVIGYLGHGEARRLGWSPKCHWLVKCSCGRYESRSSGSLKPCKEYGGACTFCKNAWAEAVKLEYAKTGRIPPGGLPTHRASNIDSKRK